jgi:phosphotransferase system enzyme I (PtsP)
MAHAMLARERERLKRLNRSQPRQVQLGVMLEVPSLLFDLDQLFERVDFVSVGTNDLMQFMFAVDRENMLVSNRFDPLHPSFLRPLRRVAEAAQRSGKKASICGEMAGRPLEALALLGLGFRSFSMSPSNVGPIKALVRAVNLDALERFVLERLETVEKARSLRTELSEFAAVHDLSF